MDPHEPCQHSLAPNTIEIVASLTFYHWIIIEELVVRTIGMTALAITNASKAMIDVQTRGMGLRCSPGGS